MSGLRENPDQGFPRHAEAGAPPRHRAERLTTPFRVPEVALVTLVDLGLSNVASVLHAFARLGTDAEVTRDPDRVRDATAVVVPGVGSFGDGMASLRDAGLVETLQHRARAHRPVLGICLGMQLMAEMGTERGAHPGLGLVPGMVLRLEPPDPTQRVPNVGWCDTEALHPDGPVPAQSGCFYFVHGYHLFGPPEDVQAATDVGGQMVAAAIARGAVWGVQFHPEKSQDDGLAVLRRFLAASVAGVTA